MASSSVCTSPLAVITVIGLLDVVTVSNSAEVKSFLLTMCIDAPESTTNSLSYGLIVDVEGRHQFSEGEKNVVSCFSLNFRIRLAIFHAASRAYRSCLSVSSWDRSSNFGALGLRWWGSPGQNYSERWFLVSNVSMTYDGFYELNTSDWLQYVWALPQNRWRPRQLHVLKYATQLSYSFQHGHCTVVTIIFIPFGRLFINLAMCIRALVPNICIHFLTCGTSTLEDATFHRMEWCNFLWGNPCTGVEPFSHLGFCLWDSWFPMHFSHSVA